MHLGPKIFGVELAFLSVWWREYSLNYALWRIGVIKCKSKCTVLLIFQSQMYTNLRRWRIHDELLAHFRREVYMECTLVYIEAM